MTFGPKIICTHLEFFPLIPNGLVSSVAGTLLPTDVYYILVTLYLRIAPVVHAHWLVFHTNAFRAAEARGLRDVFFDQQGNMEFYAQMPSAVIGANQTTQEDPFLIAYTNTVLDLEAQALNAAATLQAQAQTTTLATSGSKSHLSPIDNLALDATTHATHFDTLGVFLRPVHLHGAWGCNTPAGLRRSQLESYEQPEQTEMMKAGLFDAWESRGYHAYG